jgi:predicted nucleic acid-binding protein
MAVRLIRKYILSIIIITILFISSCISYKRDYINILHPIINSEYDAVGMLVTIYVPETRENVTYEAYQNIAGIANLGNAVFDDIDLGLASIINNNRDLSPTVKRFMREKDITIMFFDLDGKKYANLRLTNPETFWFIEYSSDISYLEIALKRAANVLINSIPKESNIAIVFVNASDNNISEYIASELEYLLVTQKFTLIDRSQLDLLRQEHKFQMSGEVDDNTAVSIGKISGANVIITGNVTGISNIRRLRLRALNTQTAQVLAVSSERY